jgi:hypothetical protein
MKQLQAKVSGNTMKNGIPDAKGEIKAQREMTRIGKSMGIGDSADVKYYLSRVEANSKKATAAATAKRVAAQRASDKKTMPPKKMVKKVTTKKK